MGSTATCTWPLNTSPARYYSSPHSCMNMVFIWGVETQNFPKCKMFLGTFCVRDILWQLAALKCPLTQTVPTHIFYGSQFVFWGHFVAASCHKISTWCKMSPRMPQLDSHHHNRRHQHHHRHHHLHHWYLISLSLNVFHNVPKWYSPQARHQVVVL